MLVPLSTDRPLSRNRVVTPVLIALNLGVFALGLIMEQGRPEQFEALQRDGVLWRLDFHWYQLITYAFLHAGWLHALGNMVFLWTFGGNLEDKLGRVWFTLFYLAGGAAAGAVHMAFSPMPVLGASGAVSACTGAYLMLFPRTHIRCFVLFFYIGVLSVPAWWFIGGSVVWDLTGGFGHGGNVAHGAHLGGFAFGFLVTLALRAVKILTPEEWDLFTQMRHARRRSELRAAVEEAEKERTAKIAPTPEDGRATAARSEIAALLGRDRPEEAARAYVQYASLSPAGQRPMPLARRQQLDVANQLFTMGEHRAAADAYELFAEVYRNDTEEPNARVILALICVRYLRDAERGRKALEGVAARVRDAQNRELAGQLQAELTAMATPAKP
ncbi:MAG: rhomboid family intramembrane serine protease [Phycisphaerales bacterium]